MDKEAPPNATQGPGLRPVETGLRSDAADAPPTPERARRSDPSAPGITPDEDTPKAPENSDEGGGSDTSSGNGSKRRRRLLIFLVVAVLILGGAGFCWWFFYARFYTSTDDAFIDAQIVRIAPQVEGRLTEVPIQSNTEVKAGDVLARIDPAAVKASYDQAKAALAGARTGVTSARAQLEQAQAGVAQSQSAYQAAQVDAKNSQRKLNRLNGLKQSSGNSAVSQQQIDDADAAAQAAQAQAEKAKTAVTSARASVDAAQAGVAAAEAKQQEAQAALASAQVNLDHLTIKAPIDGQVVQLNVNTGSYVQPGQQIMALVPQQVYVTANFKETQLASIHPGEKVSLKVDAYPGADLHGHVVSIQRGAGQAFQLLPPQNATGNYVKVVQRVPVRISIDGPIPKKYVLGPGMSVVPTVRIDSQ